MTKVSCSLELDEKAIDGIFRDLDQSYLPGAAVGIAIGGIPVYRKGFGLASMELPMAITPHTRMRVYSITKHFTCLAYLLLCEDGKANIDDPVKKYLPELHPATHRATMRQLMTHTSGLRDACDIRFFFSGMERSSIPAREVLALYEQIEDVNCAPGEAWCYNNGGYQILSAVIERLAERSLEEVFRKRIFEPAGMHDTLLRRVDTDFVPNSASMHMSTLGGGYTKKWLPGENIGEGGVVSTADDMLRWLRQMANGAVAGAESWALMSAAHKLPKGGYTGYGLGLVSGTCCGMQTISHNGGGLGSNAQMIRVPGADMDIIVLVNRSDVSATQLAGNILEACFGTEPVSGEGDTSPITAVFHSKETGRVVELYGERGQQMVRIDGVGGWPLVSAGGPVFRAPSSLLFGTFSLELRGDRSQPDGVRLEYYGATDELLPVSSEVTPALELMAGDYRADAVGACMTVSADKHTGRATMSGRFGSKTYAVESCGKHLWRLRSLDGTPWGGIIAFDPHGAGAMVRTAQSWQVRFRRLS